jgi:hypothetical protein
MSVLLNMVLTQTTPDLSHYNPPLAPLLLCLLWQELSDLHEHVFGQHISRALVLSAALLVPPRVQPLQSVQLPRRELLARAQVQAPVRVLRQARLLVALQGGRCERVRVAMGTSCYGFSMGSCGEGLVWGHYKCVRVAMGMLS